MRRAPALALACAIGVAAPFAAQEAMAPEVTISQSTVCYLQSPQAAYDAVHDQYMVVWYDWCSGETPVQKIRARRLDRYGRALGPEFDVTPTADGRSRNAPAIAFDPANGRYQVSYVYDYYGDGSDLDVRSRFLAWYGLEPAWVEFAIAGTSEDEWSPSAAFSPTSSKFLVTWSKQSSTDGFVVWGQLLQFGGPQSSFAIATPGYRLGADAGYCAGPDRFVVTYDDSWDVSRRTVEAASGAVSAESIVSTAPEDDTQSAVASCGNEQALVAWQMHYDPDWDIYARYLLADGTPDGPELVIRNTTGDERGVDAACRWGGAEYLLVHEQEYAGGLRGVWGRRIDTLKQARPNFGILVPTETVEAKTPAVAGGGAGWLVVWEHSENAPETARQIHSRVVWELFADGFEWGDTTLWSATVSP